MKIQKFLNKLKLESDTKKSFYNKNMELMN